MIKIPYIVVNFHKNLNDTNIFSIFIHDTELVGKKKFNNIKFTIGTLIRISMHRLFFEQTILQLVGFKVKGNRSHLLKEFNFQPEGKINLTIHQYLIKTFLEELQSISSNDQSSYIKNNTGENLIFEIDEKRIFLPDGKTSEPFTYSEPIISIQINKIKYTIDLSKISELSFPLFMDKFYILVFKTNNTFNFVSAVSIKNSTPIDFNVIVESSLIHLNPTEEIYLNYKIKNINHITIQKDNNSQTIELNELKIIEINSIYAYIYKKRDQSTFVNQINIFSPIEIVNHFPFNISVSIISSIIEIIPEKHTPIPCYSNQFKNFKFEILKNEIFRATNIIITLKEEDILIKTHDNSDKIFFIKVKTKLMDNKYLIDLMPEIIIKDLTHLSFNYSITGKEHFNLQDQLMQVPNQVEKLSVCFSNIYHLLQINTYDFYLIIVMRTFSNCFSYDRI